MTQSIYTGRTAGIDIGSRSIELVVIDTAGRILQQVRTSTTFDPLRQCRDILEGIGVERTTATGYGRKLFVESGILEPCGAITEIQAYALGTALLFPEARTVLDIGGQDTKVISLGPGGRVLKFEMNDRCAAGTGKFLEIMATSLQVPIEEFGDFALRATKQVRISSMCTVFAESEATSLMGRGERPENIAMGLHLAIVERTMAMLNRVGLEPPLCFAGGVAHNRCVIKLLRERIGERIVLPEQPDMVGALGAALHGLRTGSDG
ncbi:CoA-substrate-specific enzyme activase, putative [Desulfonatronum zhilinae]|nr:CoA-substrate-specific enzyme activase, putative [Desulfonatronum zhilinae]